MGLFGKKILSEEDLRLIAKHIADAEATTRGEIRVAIREKRSFWERSKSLEELAIKEFYRLGMERTVDSSGVLIFILFADHQFEILADKGIDTIAGQRTWRQIADGMSEYFKEGKFGEGICNCVDTVGALLAQHFPRRPGDTDELPNQVVMR